MAQRGEKLSEEKKENLRNKIKSLWQKPEYRKSMSDAHKGYKHSDEAKIKVGVASSARPRSQKTRDLIGAAVKNSWSESRKKNFSEWSKGRVITDATREKMSVGHIGLSATDATRAKKRIHMKQMWSNPEWKEKQVKKVFGAFRTRKNKLERYVEETLDAIAPNEWAFVGDGKMILAGKVPDFVNANGRKKIIEVYGDYWHRGDDPQVRIDLFMEFGYKTLVLWEREIRDESVFRKKLMEFINA